MFQGLCSIVLCNTHFDFNVWLFSMKAYLRLDYVQTMPAHFETRGGGG